MQKLLCLIIGFVTLGCNPTKLLKEYKLYQRDKSILYPKEKLSFKFQNDSIGEFINVGENQQPFNQKFNFERIKDDFLVIKEITPINNEKISLKAGDTVIIHKRQLHFFYKGSKKYLLSFKRS